MPPIQDDFWPEEVPPDEPTDTDSVESDDIPIRIPALRQRPWVATTPDTVNDASGRGDNSRSDDGEPLLNAWLVETIPLAVAVPVLSAFNRLGGTVEATLNIQRRTRRGRLLLGCTSTFVAVAVVPVIIGLLFVLPRDGWLPRDRSSWIDLIQKKMPSVSFDDPSSPQTLALEWMVSEFNRTTTNMQPLLRGSDNRQDYYQDKRKFLDRFALATFWYATGGNTSAWKHKHLWMSHKSVCQWGGLLFCGEGGYVEEFKFGGLSTGNIPKEMGLLTRLSILSLLENNFESSTIPSELGALTRLKTLALVDSKLSGTLPTELVKMRNLRKWDISGNNFSGTLPETRQLSKLSHLNYVRLFNNPSLVGTIPSSLCRGLDRALVDCDKITCDCCSSAYATPCSQLDI